MRGSTSGALRMRGGSLAGTFVMIAMTAAIVAVAAQLMATALGAPGPGRFAAADAVVRANPTVTFGHGEDAEKVDVQRSALLPPDALARAAAVPGVRAAVGDVAFPLTVIGRGGAPLATRGDAPAHGHGWDSAALTPYRLAAGTAPAAARDVVLDAALARNGGFRVGDAVRLVTPAGAGTFRLAGIATASRAQEQRQSSVFLTPARAQQLSGLGPGYAAIAIRADAGADGAQLRERLGEAIRAALAAAPAGAAGATLSAAPGATPSGASSAMPDTASAATPQVLDHRSAATADAGDPRAFDRIELVALLGSSGGITLAIVVFVVAGTIAFAVGRRRREIALLRAVGATPGQLRRMLLRNVALIGLLAGATGCAAATLLFTPVTDALVAVGVAPDGFTVAPHWIPYAIAVSSAVVVALLATLVASRRALAVRPSEALAESALPQRRMSAVRALLGLVALGGGITIVIVLSSQAISFATLAALLFMIAIALLAPYAVGWPGALAGLVLRGSGRSSGFLAGSALGSGRFRVGAVGASIALVVALAGTQVVSLATAERATERTTAQRVHADRVLVARGGGGLPPAVAHAAARLPGASAAGVVATDVFLLDPHLGNAGDSWPAAGLEPAATRTLAGLDPAATQTPAGIDPAGTRTPTGLDPTATRTLDLGVTAGSLDAVTGDGVAVSERLADSGGLRVGSVLHARMADAAPARLRVVAIYRRSNGLGELVLPSALALAHATAPLDSAVFVSGGDDPAVARGLAAIARAVPTVVVRSRAEYLSDVRASGQESARAQWVVVALMIAIAAMAAFNTGAMAASERRGELVLARLCGATRAQVAGSLTLESLVTTLVGIGVGVVVVLVSLASAGGDPTGGPLVFPAAQAGLVLGGALVLGLAGTLVPAALVGRTRLTAVAGTRT